MKGRKWLLALLTIALLAVGAFAWLALNTALRLRAFRPVAKTLPEELAAARTEGLPLEPAELRRDPPVPAAQNAAPLYRQITAIWRKQPESLNKADGNALSAVLKPTRTEADRANARLAIERNAEVLRLAEHASRLPSCDFQRSYEQGPDLLFPEYAAARHTARLLAARAVLESDEGRPEAALDDIAAGARVGRHVAEDHVIIAMLVRIAVDTIMDRVFQQVIVAHRNRPDVLKMAERTCAAFGKSLSPEEFIGGEVIMGRACTRMIRDGRWQGEGFPPVLTTLGEQPGARGAMVNVMCDAWDARLLSYWRRLHAVISRANGDLLAEYRGAKALADSEEAHMGQPTYELEQILYPVYTQAIAKVMHDEAERRLRTLSLAVLIYRLDHHTFPASLADLPGRAPVDPFTDQPLLYRRTSEGCIVYSVGENFKDDGGRSDRDKEKRPLDIVIELPLH